MSAPLTKGRVLLGLAWFACAFWGILEVGSVYEFNPDYSHGYLVPVIAGIAWWRQRKVLSRDPARPSVLGVPLVGAGAALLVLGYWYDTAMQPGGLGVAFIMGCGLWLTGVGLALASQGPRRVLAYSFVVWYLLFGIPLPESWTGLLTLPMRRWVTEVSAVLLNGVGFGVERAGNVLYFDTFFLGIADACSGIRSLLSLVASTVAIGYLIDCRPKHLLALALVALPLSFAQNVLRVIVTAFAMRYVDPRFGEGWRHEGVGWVTFVLAALVAVWLANRWSRDEEPGERAAPTGDDAKYAPPSVAGKRWVVGLALTGLIVGAVAQGMIRLRYYGGTVDTPAGENLSLRGLPTSLGVFDLIERSELDAKSASILNPSSSYLARWSDLDGTRIHVMVFRWSPQRLGVYGSTFKPHSPEVCYPNSGWQMDDSVNPTLPMSEGSEAEGFRRVFQQGNHRRLVLFVKNQDPGAAFAQEFPSPVRARWAALVRSWNEADLELGAQFSVSVAVDIQPGDSVAHAEAVARHFMRLWAQELVPYDMRFSLQ